MFGHVLIFLACLITLAIASAGQSAFAYLNATRYRSLMQHGATRSQAVQQITHEPGPLLASISLLYLLAVAVATLVAVDFAWWQFTDPLPQFVTLGVAALLLLGTQHVARGVATVRPERAAMLLYRPLSVFGVISRPLMAPWHMLTNAVLRKLFGVEDRVATTEEDMRALVDVVEETAALEEDERDMITSIFELSDRDVREIMVPRVDVVALPISLTVNEATDVLVTSGHSRVPVYEGDLDHVAGMIHLRDLAQALRAGRGVATVSQFLRPVHIVPETKKIDELLREFQDQRIQMAVVADEYGGTAGVATIEDLLEEIVGEIRDEYDVDEEELIQRISRTEALMDARVSIHDAAEIMPIEVDDGDYETIGGLVYQRLDKVPAVGDVVQLERCTIKVVATKGRRVQRVLVTIASTGETAEAPAQNA
jgi:CBS domain containing-hemolysin-like protein